VSWGAILGLAGGIYAMKAIGPIGLAGRQVPARVQSLLGLLAVALLGALVAVQTLGRGEELTLDARVPALGVAALLVWRRMPFVVIVLAAAGTAALLRLP
jgi:branched-subunit amino acid transport protein